jgi:putative ABC transport system substrate-binding protein
VAVLYNADNLGSSSIMEEMARASAPLGLQVLRLPVRGPSDFAAAFQAATRARAEALAVLDDAAVTKHRRPILDLAAQHALPVGSISKDFAEAGGLIAYGPNLPALYRRAAYYVERILPGAKPADLPVEPPTPFDLVINLKTATHLGIPIPPAVLYQADMVIR